MAANSQTCERARGWASLRLDGELSELESALLRSHLDRCEACARFACGADHVAAALRLARLERPGPVALVFRSRRRASHVIQAGLAIALVTAAGAAAVLVGVGRQPSSPPADRPVAVVAVFESPDAFRALRRPLLLAPSRELPRNRRVPAESA
jgi:hypothetical protein